MHANQDRALLVAAAVALPAAEPNKSPVSSAESSNTMRVAVELAFAAAADSGEVCDNRPDEEPSARVSSDPLPLLPFACCGVRSALLSEEAAPPGGLRELLPMGDRSPSKNASPAASASATGIKSVIRLRTALAD